MTSYIRLGALWVLLVAAAAEVYDELPRAGLENEGVYQDSEVESAPRSEVNSEGSESEQLKDVVMYRLLQAHMRRLRSAAISAVGGRRSKPPLGAPAWQPPSGLLKRLAGSRQQQQQNPPGSSMVCYFKLCSFRRPD